MATLWRGYIGLLGKFPLPTMATTTGILMGAGDCISQTVIEKTSVKNYDMKRTGRFVVIGFCVFGPLLRGWYLTLDKIYAGKKLSALKMMATDQLCGAPVFISIFVSGMCVLRGENLEQLKGKMKRDYVPIMMTNYKVWPAAQLINFYFLPLQHRVLFVNFVSLGWNTYLAWASERK